ncbi:hypothetical protein B0H13DRAFT_2341836 [Mycena leptocephala]|nr:hypothetical protein B0H13DRAFT_2341836 [Mycena leptocephala]
MSIGGQQDQIVTLRDNDVTRRVKAPDTTHFNAPTHFKGHRQGAARRPPNLSSLSSRKIEIEIAPWKVARLRNLPSNKENVAPSASTALPPQKPVAPPKDWKHEFQKLQRRHRHTKTRQKKLEAELAAFKSTDAATKHTADLAAQRVKELSAIIERFVIEGHKSKAASKETIDGLRKQIKALKQRIRRSIRSFSRRVDRAKKQFSVRRVTAKGIYTVEARKLARIMVDSGLEEGGVAAKIQTVFELSLNKGVTISADSTSNRGINIEGAHLATCVPDYASGSLDIDPQSIPNPLAQSLKRQYSVREFLKILKGMNSDHASNEKSTAKGLKERKHEEAINELGEQALAGKEFMDLVEYLGAWNAKKTDRDAKLMKEIVAVLGKEVYDALDPNDRQIWICSSGVVAGGNAEMMLEWKKLGVPGPVLLANKENAALLRHVFDPIHPKDAVLTEDQFRAFHASTRGGVKACGLAGAIFNNKDDKKGQGDRHVDFMTRKLGKPHRRFPDTNNTRFGSHADAAAELIIYLLEYLDILRIIEWSKHIPSLTNIEKNLLDALQDPCTLTELVAMILYRVLITHPYLRQVRGPGTENTNLLDLGPLHREVRDHIQSILDDPDLIFGTNVSYETATLDGLSWSDSKAMEAVLKLIPSLPYVRQITLAFFRGALTTWIRFSAEFAPGGIIDLLTATERQLAWMPSTNDANEGCLGHTVSQFEGNRLSPSINTIRSRCIGVMIPKASWTLS